MVYIRRGILLIFLLAAGIFLHYSLPDREIVRIVGTEILLVEDRQPDGTTINRDQRQINGEKANGRTAVFRNEDTDWSWPPYFKFDSADLQAKAQSFSTEKTDGGQWVVLTHYGWRIPILSMFPNAVAIRKAEGPEEELFPWFNLIVISLLALFVLIVRRVLILMYDRHIGATVDMLDQQIEDTGDAISARYTGFSGWLRRRIGG